MIGGGGRSNGNTNNKNAKIVYREIEDQQVIELSETIKELKNTAHEISKHLDSENKEVIGKMSSNFDVGSNALQGVMGKLDEVLRSGSSSRTTCYLIAIIAAFFMVLFLLK